MGYDPSHHLIDWFCSVLLRKNICLSFYFLMLIAGEAIALGFEHYILALGTAVMIPSFLVPMMGGDDVSLLLLHSFFIRRISVIDVSL